MSMEKQGIVDENTPAEQPGCKPCCSGGPDCKSPLTPATKEAADKQEEHLTTRLSDAAADAFKK
jgi:hypothetical protein